MNRVLAGIAALFLTAVPAFAAIEIQEVTSEGGIDAWLVEDHSIPFTALEIRFEGGSALDRDGKRGEINLMMALLEEGTGDMDSRGFAEAREALAASYQFDAYLDSVSVSAKFLTENRADAVELLRKALIEPRFDEESLERVRGQVYSVIRSEQTDPGDIASDRFFANAFGDHPYGSSSNGTLESVAGLTQEDMFTAKDRAMVRDRLFVGAVGDITADELGDVLDTLFGALPETGPAAPPHVSPTLAGGVEVVPFDTPQSVVYFGHEGIARYDEDYIPAYIANEILGGRGESRLMKEVREKRGLTYGVGTSLVPFDSAELILGQFSSGNAVAAQAIEVVQEEWRKFHDEGVTAEELDMAKTYLTGAYPLRFDGNAPIASILAGMQMVGLDPDYVTERNAMVEAVTLEEVNRVARVLYDPEALSFVVVGQPEGLQSN